LFGYRAGLRNHTSTSWEVGTASNINDNEFDRIMKAKSTYWKKFE